MDIKDIDASEKPSVFTAECIADVALLEAEGVDRTKGPTHLQERTIQMLQSLLTDADERECGGMDEAIEADRFPQAFRAIGESLKKPKNPTRPFRKGSYGPLKEAENGVLLRR